MNFSSDAMADFEGLLEVNRKICKQQMAEKASPTLPTNCAVLPLFVIGGVRLHFLHHEDIRRAECYQLTSQQQEKRIRNGSQLTVLGNGLPMLILHQLQFVFDRWLIRNDFVKSSHGSLRYRCAITLLTIILSFRNRQISTHSMKSYIHSVNCNFLENITLHSQSSFSLYALVIVTALHYSIIPKRLSASRIAFSLSGGHTGCLLSLPLGLL